ncbi:phage terminase small subunit P27 family [Neomegalonema sp.]|uniref:phage terminase small subunit P27 family n=1 Tax=Neomegalonema sp. TaxID=2039713 RepID=UPI00260B90F2|nr:phage terminase small subunit P27 family [Neomegalonema sp.]MDD2870334.1 phage terminase small subunit P27 family [Neomegalonema sp.]
MRGDKPQAKANVHHLAASARMTPPDPPEHLTPDAAAKWRALAPELTRLGRLQPRFHDAFELYCEAYADWLHNQRLIAAEGRIYASEGRNGSLEKKKQAVQQRDEAAALMLRVGANFGLSPRDDAALNGDAQGDFFAALEDRLSGRK